MEAALVGVGTGVMKPLLSKLSNLLEKEYAKLKGVRRELESTRAEMCSMKAALEALAEAEQLDPEMIAWRDEVRELSFDMEDSVDDFMARADTKQDGRKGLKGFFDKLKKLKPRHEIAREIKELKARAVGASEMHKRYKLGRSTPDSTTCDIDPRLDALYVEVDKLVGIEGPKKHIIDWFKNEGSSTQLRVVSIVGPGGLGKTTLGNAVFRTIEDEFSCKAFVSVSRKPNMKIVLKEIARRVGVSHDPSNDDEQWLIESLRKHLRDKKYLIVIDDLWSPEAWKTIKDALLNNENGSRIITTTRNSAVASFCSSEGDYVYRMEPLGSVDSRRLFLGRAFHSEDLCPPHLKEVSERILEKCAGLPLAIITMSSLLADQTAEEVWNKALAAVGSSLAKEDGAGDMTKILSLSYFDLPHYMKGCLLYLSAYPEDYIIEKKSLIHKWMAEGFVHEVEGQSTYEVGESYFNDLINRSLIQPAESNRFSVGQYGEVMACRVHDIILDFITCKAKEENFMTSYGDAEHGKKHKVRRLSVMSRDNGMATVSGDLSHVRSLAILGYAWQNFGLEFPVLRVLDLDIERCSDLGNDHLENIEKLLLLKYLCLRTSYSITEIPEGIGKLKYLETLDMRGFRIRKLPSTMTQLQRLARLYAKFEPACLSDGIIGQLQSLEELEDVQVSDTELEKFLEELGQLTKLRTLSVYVVRSTLSKRVDNVSFVRALISSYNLHHLTIRYDTDHARECLLSPESWFLVNNVALRKICIDDYSIDKVPYWMFSQKNLSVLHLSEIYCTGPEDIAVLGGMPALVALKLKTWYGRNGKIFVRTGFRRLKYFSLDIYCCGTAVEFKEGSMPKLEHLELKFQAHQEECVNYAFDFGIQHLSALSKLDLSVFGDNDIIHKLIETALGKFRHRPTLSWKCEGSGVCLHFETALEQEWEEEKEREKENGECGGPCSFLGLLLEEIKQDVPRLRVLSTVPRKMPLDFLRNITDQFSERRIIGTGAFGTVYEGTMPDGQSIAVKKLAENAPLADDKEFTNGVQYIMSLQNENIVKFVGYCHEGQKKVVLNNGRYIVADVIETILCYEYLPMGSLQKNLFEGPNNMVWHMRFKIIKGICKGLLFLHKIPSIHMDLKPEKILLDQSMMPKIAGIGFSGQTRENTENVVGSCGYMAPELVYRGEISIQSDIYSLGLLIIQTTTGERNQPKQNDPSAREFIEKVHKIWTDGHIVSMYPWLNPNDLLEVKICMEIGLECVLIDRKKRPSIETIVERLDGVELALPSIEKKIHSSEVCAGVALLSSANRMANQFNQGEPSSSICTKNYLLATEPMAMTFEELQRMTDGFSEERLLGAGGYGRVYKGVLDNGEVIAVKKLHSNPKLVEASFKNELMSLMRSQHPNIIRLLGYCSETRDKVLKHEGGYVLAGEQERVLCLEYMQGGNLEEHLSDESCGLDWEARYKIIKGICHGLKHLHTGYKDPIYHLDLKPANILLDKERLPKIGDFGLSRLHDSAKTIVTETFSGTRGYLPPEYIDRRQISPKFDVYSLGVIIIQVIAGREGYHKSADMTSEEFIDLVTDNWRKRVQETNMTSDELLQVQKCTEIGLRCVDFKRVNRPTITQVVEELDMIS